MKRLWMLALAATPLGTAHAATVVRLATQAPPIVIEAVGARDGIVILDPRLTWQRVGGETFLIFTNAPGKKARVRTSSWRAWATSASADDEELSEAFQQAKALLNTFLPAVQPTGRHSQIAGIVADGYTFTPPGMAPVALSYSADPRLSAATALFYDAVADLTGPVAAFDEAKRRGLPVEANGKILISVESKPDSAIRFERNARLLGDAAAFEQFMDSD